jgi:hypothetical protein
MLKQQASAQHGLGSNWSGKGRVCVSLLFGLLLSCMLGQRSYTCCGVGERERVESAAIWAVLTLLAASFDHV